MKKISIIICLLTIISILFASCGASGNTTTENSSTETPQGGASAYGTSSNASATLDEVISEKLRIDTSTDHTVKYVHDVYTGDAGTDEYCTEEVMATKEKEVEKFFEVLGTQAKEITNGKALKNTVDFSGDGFTGSVYYGSLNVTPDEMSLTVDSTDEEILNYFNSRPELVALAKYSGVDLENVFINRSITRSNTDENNRFCKYNICTNVESPEELAYNVRFNSISFNLYDKTEDDENSSTTEGTTFSVAQQLASDFDYKSNTSEITVPASAYKTAAETAARDISANTEPKEDVTADKLSVCTITYTTSQEKSGYIIPCYRFYYVSDSSVYYSDVALTEYLPA